MAVLLLNHNIPHFTTAKIARKYDQLFSTGVWKKTLAVIGVGHMGGAAANGAKRLGMRVIGIRQSREPHADVDEMFGPADLPQVLARADFVLVTTPLTAATTGLIGRREFDLMKPWAGLINMSRAGVVDYVALADKLRARELSGAVLDVFDPEPLPPTSFLWDVPNLILTPHVSSDEAEDYSAGCLDLFFENINRIQSERPIINQVDLVRGY
jgi:phosphoglycerate dehydrogenase-like enzyme